MDRNVVEYGRGCIKKVVYAEIVGTYGSCVRCKTILINCINDIYADARAVRPYTVITLTF